MLELLEDAGEELKRADHLIYVSLKYTRTADVLMNCLTRMIDAYGFLIDGLLEYALDAKKIEEIPKTPLEKGNLVKKIYPQQEINDNIELFFLLRKIYRAPHEKQEEYRRHVAIITILDGREEMVNIDIVTQYYQFEVQFYKFVVEMLKDRAKEKHKEDNEWEY
jgi:hypothetical protein